jgi:hypothetical protein
MDAAQTRRPSITVLLVGLVLLVTVLGAVVSLVPLVPCPDCSSRDKKIKMLLFRDKVEESAANDFEHPGNAHPPYCYRCRNRERVTILHQMFRSHVPPEDDPWIKRSNQPGMIRVFNSR